MMGGVEDNEDASPRVADVTIIKICRFGRSNPRKRWVGTRKKRRLPSR